MNSASMTSPIEAVARAINDVASGGMADPQYWEPEAQAAIAAYESLRPETPTIDGYPLSLWLWLSDDRKHVRKFSHTMFPEGVEYRAVVEHIGGSSVFHGAMPAGGVALHPETVDASVDYEAEGKAVNDRYWRETPAYIAMMGVKRGYELAATALRALSGERDAYQAAAVLAETKLATAEAELARCKRAFEKYGRHDGLCGIIGGYGFCTCGYDAALSGAPAQDGGQNDG
jgi:hypothetical protein